MQRQAAKRPCASHGNHVRPMRTNLPKSLHTGPRRLQRAARARGASYEGSTRCTRRRASARHTHAHRCADTSSRLVSLSTSWRAPEQTRVCTSSRPASRNSWQHQAGFHQRALVLRIVRVAGNADARGKPELPAHHHGLAYRPVKAAPSARRASTGIRHRRALDAMRRLLVHGDVAHGAALASALPIGWTGSPGWEVHRSGLLSRHPGQQVNTAKHGAPPNDLG